MKELIGQLDDLTDKATKQMLDNVVKRKEQFDKLKFRHMIIILLACLSAFCFISYVYMTIALKYSYSFYAMFSAFFNDPVNMFLFVASVALYGAMLLVKEQKDKKEKEFHELRCEIVDRSKDLWKSEEQWASRYKVFEMMKKEFDINLYHEKK